MKVVIVAKTRMGAGACVGGLTFDGRSVRLIPPDAAANPRFNQEYNIGDVWEVTYRPDETTPPPHVENIVVVDQRQLPPLAGLVPFILRQMPPKSGGLAALFDGLTQATSAGALYIAERTGLPGYSTMFWQPDQPLRRDDDHKRIRYRYPTADGGRTLTFVGYQEPVEELPAGSLLRVSLAHWWRPEEKSDGELRCYVQLSGWFLEPEPAGPALADGPDWLPPPGLDWLPAPDDLLPFGSPDQPAEPTAAVAPLELPPAVPAAPLDMAGAARMLKRVFGYDSFWPLQAEVIDNVLQRRDSLAIMPTGSGKSLCYQLPGLLFPGLTVVVSPLISLMEDQVAQLRELGVPAVFLNSTLNYSQYLATTAAIRAGRVKLLYVAPETLLRPETLLLLEQSAVDCLTIDEAHCISEWGHDFRPEYRQLVAVRRRLPAAVCLAVTATATERVRQDIVRSLDIAAADQFLASFNRANLFLGVAAKSDGLAQTLAFLAEHREESGIIYCATRRAVDGLATQLQAHGWPALPYHAGLDDATRRRHQRTFTHDDVPIMVATIAFGMGIDKSNVRFILHYDLPQNLESYYQQIGRSGRDGLRADCLLLYSFGDVATIRRFIQQKAPAQQPGAEARLQAMLSFVETAGCRRRPLLSYFGETVAADACGMCDNCQVDERELVDLTIPAQKFLSCVKRTGELFGMAHIIDVLRGSRAKRVLQKGHDRLSTYNIGGEFSKQAWQQLARQFIDQGLLQQDMDYGSLKLTGRAYAVFRGERFMGVMPDLPPAPAAAGLAEPHDPELFTRLRDKRKELADAAGVPPYVIFSDRSLVEMATYFPQSPAAFGALYGVGQHKLERYAPAFLPLIAAYCAEKGLAERPKTAVTPARPAAAGSRPLQVAGWYNDGRAIPDIAAELGIKPRTVIGHLWQAAQSGIQLRPDGLLQLSELPPAEQQRALDAFADHGPQLLRPIYDALDGAVSYDELHLLRLYFVARG